MPLVLPKKEDFGASLKIVSFDDFGGLQTKKPHEMISDNASPRLRNVVLDRNGTLEGIWGTKELLTINASGYNSTITNPIYHAYPFTGSDGVSRLIIQGVHAGDGYMSLYAIERQTSYPYAAAPTRILGASQELVAARKCSMCTWKSRLYVTNGSSHLRYWDGNEWRIYHEKEAEHFRYITPYARRLWMASSAANPSRIIYTNLNECNFHSYYASGTNSIDFSKDGDDTPITWIKPWQAGLLIFKSGIIYLMTGTVDDPQFTILCQNKGTVSGWSVQANESQIYFMGRDGFYLMGEPGLAVTQDDQTVRTERAVVRISSEIDNIFKDDFTIPDPEATKEKVWSGATAFSGFTLTNIETRTAPLTENPDILQFSFGSKTSTTYPPTLVSAQTTRDGWVDLRSTDGEDVYYSQSDKLDLDANSYPEISFPRYVRLRLKSTGTIATTHKVNVYVCDGKEDDTEPDFDNTYAEGQITGTNLTGVRELPFDAGVHEPTVGQVIYKKTNHAVFATVNRVVLLTGSWAGSNATGYLYLTTQTGAFANDDVLDEVSGAQDICTANSTGDSLIISGTEGCDVLVEMTYFDNPQNLLDGHKTTSTVPTYFIAVKAEGDTDAAYLQWGYKGTASSYANGRMYNSDTNVPAGNQANCDYTFGLYNHVLLSSGTVVTDAFDSNTLGTNAGWGKVFVGLNEDALGGYVRNSKIETIKYATGSTSTLDPTNGTAIKNGGAIAGTDRWIKFYIKFTRPTSYAYEKQDSFSLQYIKVTFTVQAIAETLISSAIYEGSYYCSIYQIMDREAQVE